MKKFSSSLLLPLALSFLAAAPLSSAQAPPSAPVPQAAGISAPSAAPVIASQPSDPLPAANPKLFTAKSPSVDTVNAFLHAVWGYDPNRLYRVMAIQPTQAPGVVRVIVFVLQKNAPEAKVQSATFFVTPDGNFAMGEGATLVPFGAQPYAALRDTLRERATGASRGDPSKDLELVEFADLQCPHCKDAQPVMEQLRHDFPKSHIVFQLFPLVDIHPSAFKAAAYATCAQQQSNDAFFQFAADVFDTQDRLTPQTDDTLLKAAARNANLDPDAIAKCASSPATVAQVDADIKLATDAGITETPTLVVNGRPLPMMSLPYDTLKTLIQYQATLDHVDSGATPETLAHHPPAPTLNNLPN